MHFLNDKHLNTQELVQTDFQRFKGKSNFTRAKLEQTPLMTKTILHILRLVFTSDGVGVGVVVVRALIN